MESPLLVAILVERSMTTDPEGRVTEELVQRARSGDHAAFERLAGMSVDRLYAIAYRVLRDPTAAEDAVQDCLFRAWRDLRALRDPGRWDAWLYRLLLNACRDEQRRSQRRVLTVDIPSIDQATDDDTAEAFEVRDQLERGFRRLSIEHRMALALHFYAGLRPGEVATALGIPPGTATSRLHYGSKALRAALEADLRAGTAPAGAVE
jgi:RNA polymerase sigma-70 factor (ECF subfamily)